MAEEFTGHKRRRKDDQVPTSQIEKHETLYIADGNVVLLASNEARKLVAFCVHKSTLTRQSPVFADMFALPASDVNETYEGLPVVRMQDKAEDLAALFEILYLVKFLPTKRLDPSTPSVVRPILSLAMKYDMESIKNQAIVRLVDDWPTTLRSWDALEDEIDALEKNWHKEHTCTSLHDCRDSLDSHLPEPVAAITLGRECAIPSILPAAFYHLSRLSMKWGPDGCVADQYQQSSMRFIGKRTAKWKSLSSQDYYTLLVGEEAMRAAVRSKLLSWNPSYHTRNGGGYGTSCNVEAIVTFANDLCNSDDVLRLSREKFNHSEKASLSCGWCGRCNGSLMRDITELRCWIWENIPKLFMLQPSN